MRADKDVTMTLVRRLATAYIELDEARVTLSEWDDTGDGERACEEIMNCLYSLLQGVMEESNG